MPVDNIVQFLNLGEHFCLTLENSMQNPEGDFDFFIEKDENTAAVFLHANIKARQPYFGAQPYFDSKEGISYLLGVNISSECLAIYQHKEWWVRPFFADTWKEVPEKTQLMLIKNEKEYLVILCVCGKEYRTDISGGPDRLMVNVSSNCINKNQVEDLSLVFAVGNNPYVCCEDAVKKALALTGKSQMFRKKRKYPEIFEYFGWCSWDAFYHDVSEKGILAKMEELKEKEIPAQWILIDDGWLDADYETQRLRSLDADKGKFPEGLGAFVKKIKQAYGIKYVGVWHAVMGYWNGLAENGEADKAMKFATRKLEDGRIVPDADMGKAFRFFHTWHSYLRNQCDIDFVKVDGQSAISLFYAGRQAYGKASEAIQCGLNASAAMHFNNQIINCMGMASEDMWNRPGSAVSRSSDDFVPDSRYGFREHAIQNGYNSLLQGQLFWGDWDMFWSEHEENWQNSILRAVSGGPVYSSDRLGMSNRKYIMPLLRRDGRVVRCEEVGLPTLDCLFRDPMQAGNILKLFNRYHDNYVITVFNVNKDNEECKGELRTSDIPGMTEQDWYVYNYREKQAYFLPKDGELSFSLKPMDGELLLLIPASDFSVAGLIEKYISSGFAEVVRSEEDRAVIMVSEAGTLGFISKEKPEELKCNGKVLNYEKEIISGSGAYLYRVLCEESGESEGCMVEIIWK